MKKLYTLVSAMVIATGSLFAQVIPISQVQDTTGTGGFGSNIEGQTVTVQGEITATRSTGYWFQDQDAAWSAVFVFDNGHSHVVGEELELTGEVAEFNGLTELTNTTATTITLGYEPQPVQIMTGDAGDEAYESVLVQVCAAACTDTTDFDQYQEFTLNDGSGNVVIDDYVYDYPGAGFVPDDAKDYTAAGVAGFAFGDDRIYPVEAAHLQEAMELSVSGTHESGCNAADGSATATATLGSSSYSYMWSNGASVSAQTGLTAGTYDVTVTDSQGCSLMDGFTVTATGGIQGSTSSTASSYCGSAMGDGTASITITAGLTPYSYMWTGGSTDATATGLGEGAYTVTATDGNACTMTAMVTVTSSATGVSASSASTATTVCGSSNGDGSIDVTVSAGVTPYTYMWDNAATTEDLTGLSAGTYMVTISDAVNCETVITESVANSSSSISVTTSGSDAMCNSSSDGSATATAGGTGSSYTYTWSQGGSVASVSGLAAGVYMVSVEDNNSCTASASVTIGEPTAVMVSTTGNNETVTGTGDGSATASASGGTGSFTYVWSNSTTGSSASGLVSGVYMVTATDANMCTGVGSVTISADLQMVSIYDIQYTTAGNGDSPYDGVEVITKGVVSGYSDYDHPSGSRNYRGYFIQDGDSAWSGLYVNDTVNYDQVSAGDTVIVRGTIREDEYPYWDYTVMREIVSFTLADTTGPEPTAVAMTTQEANDEKWEGVLVSVSNGEVVDLTDIQYGAWTINDNSGDVIVDNLMYWHSPDPQMAEKYNVTGVMFSEFNDVLLEPRRPSDVTFIGVGIEEAKGVIAKVYPNPTSGILFIETEATGSISITNSLGQVVATQLLNGNTTIDLTNESKGIYFIELQSENSSSVEKIVIE